mgnify:FL=1|jgi:hypothetical protein
MNIKFKIPKILSVEFLISGVREWCRNYSPVPFFASYFAPFFFSELIVIILSSI